MGDYRKLESWRRAHALPIEVYKATSTFPAIERYGLVVQMRRAAVSTASNIVEGCGRNRGKEMAQFVRMALGSCTELEYQVLLAGELGHLDHDLVSNLTGATSELRRMLATLHRRVVRDSAQTTSRPPIHPADS